MAVRRTRTIVSTAAAAFLTLLTIAPLAYMLMVSFMPRGESTTLPTPLWPSRFSWENYYELLVRRQ